MEIFTALADQTRRAMLEQLLDGEQSAGAIAARFHISGPAVSQHLKVLRDARLVQVRVDAQRRMYSLNVSGFDDLAQWTDRMRAYWTRRLDALAAQLAADPRAKTPRARGKRRVGGGDV